MTTALYGPDGFYRRPAGPAAHFRTSVHASPLFGEAVARLAMAVFTEAGRPPEFAVVDVGAGRGELLEQLTGLLPAGWRLIGVDVVDRPAELPDRIEWRPGLDQLEELPYGLLVANEWLDNIPLDVIVEGRLIEVDPTGRERAGGPPGDRDLAWCSQWAAAFGSRIEVGWPRDDAWAEAAGRIGTGLAVAIDYAFGEVPHDTGTLAGFRDGRQVPPVPDGSCDLTAHVLLESCARAGGGASMMTQRQALSLLGISAARPPRELASTDPAGYLRALQRTSEAAELLDPHGLGGFRWLLRPVRMRLPEVLDAAASSLG
jgi:SAM-dependent MidA family methyltransferase